MSNSSTKLTFKGSQGFELAARLDMPDGPPRAYVLFAHCFTCSKDIFAASRIAGELATRGLAVLRFDFTGLGASEGEFANTNFSSNVEDLVAAAAHMRENFAAPSILVGHSLGGAAVLAAAAKLPEVKAVATIGAPSDAAHVLQNFGAKTGEIKSTGVAEVSLAGRSFTIKKQFLEDVERQSMDKLVAGLRVALLVFHAPRDAIVGIENAGRIFAAAKHPKSFVSLDDADHLLSRREDAAYVAQVLAAWVSRYAGTESRETGAPLPLTVPGKPGVVSVAESGRGRYQQDVVVEGHRLIADEPAGHGGLGSGPSPYDFLAIALGACTSMTLRMYGERKAMALEHVRVDISHAKVHAQDCSDCGEGREGRIDRFERVLTVTGNLDDAQRARLLQIADKCPVHRTLEKTAAIVTKLAD